MINFILPNTKGTSSHIRVIAPARSLSIVANDQIIRAKYRLEQVGFTITFSRNVNIIDEFDEAKLEKRLADFHDAICDPEVDIIMSAIGGYSSADLLPFINYEQIRYSKKLFCGFSDVSVLLNNITLKTGLITFCGPHLSSFGNDKAWHYTEESFIKLLLNNKINIYSPEFWGDDTWPTNKKWLPNTNQGPKVLVRGKAYGRIIGGNIVALVGNLLLFQFELPDLIFFIEIHPGYSMRDFLRWTCSLLRSVPFGKVSAIVIGRFPVSWKLTDYEWQYITKSLELYTPGPILADMDFGHNVPFFTFPIGGLATIDTHNDIMLSIEIDRT